ncbi:MAG: LLM class flavin-dependent oxidoreductase [Halieaceae bacterium]|jgi:alkanesulfonate monooxygenase SsuD/methylene tetrahydromethanopterin reductase-like flavin-dependent oxidoreductase (luciferase family)|nr:LLM class flavin-dependent oxidoreductase [Halieaceae bacterium]
MPELGITPWRMELNARALSAQAAQAEAWGYRSFFLPESHFVATAAIPDPLLLLAAVAAQTETITLGTTSWLLPIRQPLLAAEQAASLDHLCNGRLVLGLGRGYRRGMLEAFGVNSADKRDRFDAVLSAMRSAWAGEPVQEQTVQPGPLQTPHPPLWVAAFGPKAIGQAGRLGLPYFASPVESLAELVSNYYRHAEALAEHGNGADIVRPIMRTVFVAEDPARVANVRDKLAALPAPPFRKGPQPDPEDWCLLGSAAEVGEQLARYQEALNPTHLIAVRPRVPGIDSEWLSESFEALAGMDITETTRKLGEARRQTLRQ